MQPDELLLEQLRNGLPAAYALLVEEFEGPLYRFFLCAHRDHHLAQEQTAETFAQLVRSLPGMRGSCEQLRGFIFATARHVQLRQWRQRKKQPTQSIEEFDISDPRPSPAAQAAQREQWEKVLAAIAGLEDPLRNVLLLRFVESCSLDEIAQALDMPLGTVKSHIHRGRQRLLELINNEETNHERST